MAESSSKDKAKKLSKVKRPAAALARRGQENGSGEGHGKYVYCIIHSADPLQFGKMGIGARPSEVRTVNYRDYSRRCLRYALRAYDATRENVLAHESVNESVMKSHTVIPCRSERCSRPGRYCRAPAVGLRCIL